MHLLTNLLLLIVVARLLGQVFARFQQPAIVGEMLAGILLGPSVLGLVHASAPLSGISELAVFLVVLSAGLEMNFRDVLAVFKSRGIVVAVMGFAIPFVSGLFIGVLFSLGVTQTIFLALCISITALPVTVKILESFGLLKTDVANYSVATAILNDLLAFLILGVILSLPEQKTFMAVSESVLLSGFKLVLLLSFILAIYQVFEWLKKRGIPIHRGPEMLVNFLGGEALLGIVVVFVLVFSSMSEGLGFHSVVGAFFGALILDKNFFLASRYSELEKTLQSISAGFLAPIFFAHLGLEFDIGALKSVGFIFAVLVVAVISKVAAGWLGGRLLGLKNAEAMQIGVLLNGRGVMELVVASIGLERGLISPSLFSTLVLMGVVTTVITPLMLGPLRRSALSASETMIPPKIS